MKKIYTLLAVSAIAFSANAQTSEAGKGIVLSSETLNRYVSADRLTNPDTTGLVNFTDFLPEFAPSGSIYNYGYLGGGYVYGNNASANLTLCAQGYQNVIGSPIKVIGAIAWFTEKQSDLGSSTSSKVVIKAYGMAATRSANTNGSGTFNQTLNWPGPTTTSFASADILYTAIDTTTFNYVAFTTPPTFMADFAIAADFGTLAPGDTAGLICDKPFIASGTGAGPGDAMNMDYTFHYYNSLSKWFVTDQLFSPAAGPDFGSGKCDNNVALFAVVSDATGVDEFFNGMKLTTYPNPTTQNVTIEYTLQKDAPSVKLMVMNSAGQEVINNTYTSQSAGTYKVNLDVTNLAAGTYFYQLYSGGHNFTKQLVITK